MSHVGKSKNMKIEFVSDVQVDTDYDGRDRPINTTRVIFSELIFEDGLLKEIIPNTRWEIAK
jgi:hypothetical protein